MKRKQRTFLSLLLACVMMCVPAAQVLAASSYDVTSADLSSTVLFPGDSLTGLAAGTVVVAPNGDEETVDSGSWENTSKKKVYTAAYEPATEETTILDDGTEQVTTTPARVQLTTAGYILNVVNGTSKTAEEEGGSKNNHYEYTDEEKAAMTESKDTAYYAADEKVTITAADPADGYVFAGWEVDAEDSVSIADASSQQTTITMLKEKITATATYAVETEAETTAPTEAETTAPTEAETVAATEAAVEAEVVLEDSAVESAGENGADAGVTVDTSGELVTVDEISDVTEDASSNASEADSTNSSEDNGIVIVDVEASEEELLEESNAEAVAAEAELVYSTLTVNYDTGAETYADTVSETYTAGDSVTLTAEALEGYTFSSWYVASLNVALEDLSAETITFTMPESDVTILATYEAAVNEETQAETETATAVSVAPEEAATASVSAVSEEEAAAAVSVASEEAATASVSAASEEATAAAVSDTDDSDATGTAETTATEAAETTGTDADDGILIISDENGTSTTAESATINITVNYDYDNAGTPTENTAATAYTVGETATIAAEDLTASGYTFNRWTVTSGALELSDASTQTISFTVSSDGDVVLQANYITTPATTYTVTVDGTSVGSYEAGAAVKVTQPAATIAGTVFSSWYTEAQITLTEVGDGTWTFTMPESDVVLASIFDVATHTVSIVNGTTDSAATTGTYEYGSTVSITAAAAPSGQTFSYWASTGTTAVAFASATSATTTFTMPDGDVEVTAVYVNLPNTYTVKVSNGLINGAYTEYVFEEGTQITVAANASESGQEFTGWTVNDGAYDLGDSASSSTVTVTVTQDLTFVANYAGVQYTVTVKKGSADYSTATSGTKVTITAKDPEDGYEFDYWTVTSGNVSLKNSSKSTTTFTMPAADVTVKAVYKQVKYTVTVENGSADASSYYYGDTVTVTSNYPASGKQFSTWTASIDGVTFADASKATTTFTMPAGNVTISATYEDAPTEADNYISGIVEGESYAANDKLTFTPVGAGMSNSDPNPGDVRYVPTGYSIGNVSNTWSSSPYETTMSIKKTGEYTLSVSFARQVYDGTSWVSDGTTSTTTVTFNIVNSLESVQTGDSTPIMAVAAIAIAAVLIFIVLLVVFIRRRRNEE
ncbi:MAG: InlB B-repeat-containing protein [Lachnospiraceae bacterium]|nr:InlB B-repeat-containing protein [Lachnospiraceae bacterium]